MGLDQWMRKVVSGSGGHPRVVDLSSHLVRRVPGDPHWWHDPRNAKAAVAEIATALAAADPPHRKAYERNAARYRQALASMDRTLSACFARLPKPRRKLVTSHDAFAYFAARYGLRVVGAVIPSQTTQAQPSAGDVSRLVALIKREGVMAVFPETSVNPQLARQVARETGASATYELYGDTLGPRGSAGATYISMERTNADRIVRGLTGGQAGCG
jgi:zinc/manganese transport system substrate-binding protein